MSDELSRELYQLSDRFVDEFVTRTGTDKSAQSIADTVIAELPMKVQDKLKPVSANDELVEKARALYHAARPLFDSLEPGRNDSVGKTRESWERLRGTLKAQRTEKLTVGQWLGDSLLCFSEPLSPRDVGDMLFEYTSARLGYRSGKTPDQLVKHSAVNFMSEALKSLQAQECFEDVKQACIEFRQFEQSLEPTTDDQGLDR